MDTRLTSSITHRRWRAQAWRTDAGRSTVERETPVEAAVAISFDGRPHTVLMATPEHLGDLATGFTISEGVASGDDVEGVGITEHADGWLVDVRLRASRVRARPRPRTLEGRSSCGLCGVQRLADAIKPLPPCPPGVRIRPGAILHALAALERRQPLGEATRATHAAAFAQADGEVLLVREDIGRHNALDKVAGGLRAAGLDPAQGLLLVTSRCSYEMVEKAVRMGAAILAAVSAPTDLAIRRAQEAGLTLVAVARRDGHMIFAGHERWDANAETIG
jgi:FdhD protein